MTTQHTPALETAPTSSSRGFVIAFTVITVAAAIALGVRTWHAAEGSGKEAMSRTAAPELHEGEQSAPTIAPAGAIAQSFVFLVGSDEEAEFVRRFSAEVNLIRELSGKEPIEVGVMVMNGVESSVLEGLPRTPGTRVFDLRTP